MIEEDWRYFAPGGALTPRGQSTWYILDWDQRRIIAVRTNETQEREEVAIEHLRKHIDTLASDVYAISLTLGGDLVSTSTNSDDDQTSCVYYPPLQALQPPGHVKTVLRSNLLELDRLTPNVDLVSYTPSPKAADKKVVFKYYFLVQYHHTMWYEMNLWMRLPLHPNLVPFDRLVLDELHGDVVGFTSLYIPGGTLADNTSRTFKLKWLRQLTCVIDDLNLKYGIAHQDVAGRNLVVDPETDTLMLFDFDYSRRIGDIPYTNDSNDVKGVIFFLYEIITRDTHFRNVRPDQQDSADVEGLEEWVQHPDVKLDHSVSEYRSVLDEWVKRRREGKQLAHYTEAPEYIDWPDLPEPPETEYKSRDEHGKPIMRKWRVPICKRRKLREKGDAILNWERPARNKLKNGDRLLATGQLAS